MKSSSYYFLFLIVYFVNGQDLPHEGIINLEGLDLASFLSGGDNGGDFKIDAQMAEKVRALIRHYKQDDPLGIPEGLGLDSMIKEPLKVPDLEQTFSGTKMKFNDLSLYGLNKFRLDHVRVMLSDLKISVGVSIDELFVNGLYQMSSWFTRAKGNFSVTIANVSTEAEVSFLVDEEGNLQVQDVEMDVKFGDLKMNFENLGFFGSIFQGMVNSVGGFLFDSIKPMILSDVEGKVRGELNRQARSVPQQFPNSINPVDMFLASARTYMRENQLDPFIIPTEQLEAYSHGGVKLLEGSLEGLATLHRTGDLVLSFEANIIRISLKVGAENLRGLLKWRWSILRGIFGKSGTLQFTVDRLEAAVVVGQPANLNKATTIDNIDLEVGNIAVLSEGIGTMDYVIEAVVNILPNLLRKQIVNSLEEPIRDYVQMEIHKALEIEKIIENKLPQKDANNND